MSVLSGPVWRSLPQTSPASEYVALAAFAQTANSHDKAFSDFSGSVKAASVVHRGLLNSKFVYGGIIRDAMMQSNWGSLSVSWVKAHQNPILLEAGVF
jgi:hypothetical protein